MSEFKLYPGAVTIVTEQEVEAALAIRPDGKVDVQYSSNGDRSATPEALMISALAGYVISHQREILEWFRKTLN